MKNIFICTDGTWNRTLQIDQGQLALTNVAKLARSILTTDKQLVYYDQGVGTNDFIDRFLGGAFGHGLFNNVKQAYRFIVENYAKEYQILIFGFSRGAYTARSLAGMISEVGILRKKYVSDIDAIYKLYRKKKKYARIIPKYRENFCHPPQKILFLGVWDTVGALGIPMTCLNWLTAWRYRFHDTRLSENILNACHAVAVDEKRRPFKPTLWTTKILAESQSVEQRWFPGVHSNIGGGYSDSGLSDLTFEWMLNQIKGCVGSLDLDNTFIRKSIKPNYLGKLPDSRTGIFRIYHLFPYDRKPLRTAIDYESIDDSVYERMSKDNTYRPKYIKPKTIDHKQD